MKVFNKRRYFRVTYIANQHGGRLTGVISFRCTNQYLNKSKAKQQIQEMNPCATNIVITNVNEMTAEDYRDWKK
jgi:hypothetical protein